MQMLLKRFKKEEKGFTLIELLAVIVILAVIAVIAVPLIGNIINKTKGDADVATARQVYDAARLYITSEQSGDFKSKKINVVGTGTSGAGAGLVSMGYLENGVVLPSTKVALSGGEVIFDGNGVLLSVTLTTGASTPLTTAESTNATNAASKFYLGETVLKSGK